MAADRTPAETILAAVAKLRERAEKAAPGPWNVDGPFWWGPELTGDGVQPSSTISDPDRVSLALIPSPLPDAHPRSEESAHWIAMMSPALAGPLARVLDEHRAAYCTPGCSVLEIARTLLGEA
ncbi:hypothetical protein [Herbidospora daliensis]|uniref:hypothetical protein n=1 Tax=Herbidospora daliensis TaxID=295585 RepID=UPI000785D8ED|nr:hypothetical protein [Herbidospora daliensis]